MWRDCRQKFGLAVQQKQRVLRKIRGGRQDLRENGWVYRLISEIPELTCVKFLQSEETLFTYQITVDYSDGMHLTAQVRMEFTNGCINIFWGNVGEITRI